MEEVAKLKSDMLKLKAQAKTVADSATAYQITYDFGSGPTDDNTVYVWDIYVEALVNPENVVFSCVPTGGYMFSTVGGNRYPFMNSLYPMVDANDPTHFFVPLFYYNPSYMEIHGDNAITITSNVPFRVKSAARRELTVY